LFFFLWGFLAFVFFAAGLVDFFSDPPGAPVVAGRNPGYGT